MFRSRISKLFSGRLSRRETTRPQTKLEQETDWVSFVTRVGPYGGCHFRFNPMVL